MSQLAAELDVQPSQIHQWVQAALSQIERAFETPGKKPKRSAAKLEQLKDRKIYQLEQKLNLKNEVIAELMEENDKAKKLNGTSKRTLGSHHPTKRLTNAETKQA